MGTYGIDPIYVAIAIQDQDHSKHQWKFRNDQSRLLCGTVERKNCLCKSLNCNGLRILQGLNAYSSIDTL